MSRFTTLRAPSTRLLLAGLVVAAAGAFVPPAMAQDVDDDFTLDQAGMMDGHGPGRHGGMMRGPGGHGGPGMHGGHGLQRMLDAVNATPEQRTRVKAILDAARNDMKSQHEQRKALRQQQMAVFAQPNIDARAAETLRQQAMAMHDAASKRQLQTRLDVANVLTAEQRKQLAERMAQRRAMMERHRTERQTLERR